MADQTPANKELIAPLPSPTVSHFSDFDAIFGQFWPPKVVMADQTQDNKEELIAPSRIQQFPIFLSHKVQLGGWLIYPDRK